MLNNDKCAYVKLKLKNCVTVPYFLHKNKPKHPYILQRFTQQTPCPYKKRQKHR